MLGRDLRDPARSDLDPARWDRDLWDPARWDRDGPDRDGPDRDGPDGPDHVARRCGACPNAFRTRGGVGHLRRARTGCRVRHETNKILGRALGRSGFWRMLWR
jgi:hypothetical protein